MKTTWTTAAAACRELGFTLRRTGFGSERALYKAGTTRPLDDAATYFTEDAQDAIDTVAAIIAREEEAKVLAWAASHGVPERGSMGPITTRQRAVIRFWLIRTNNVSPEMANMTLMTELSAIWHDTTNTKLNAIKQQGA